VQSGELNASSFEFYEGIRILIPGGVCVALYSGIVFTFGLNAPTPSHSIVGGVTAAIIVGLLLLFIDAPSRSAAYRTELPDSVMHAWDLPSEVNVVNFYFVLLDADIPSGVRNRALYIGSMFRIGFELIYMLAATSLGAIGVGIFIPGSGPTRDTYAVETVLWVAGSLFVALWLVSLFLDYRRSPASGMRSTLKAMAKRLGPQIWRSDLLYMVASVGCSAGFIFADKTALAVLAVALPAAVWVVRYHRGFPGKEAPQKPTVPVATTWLALSGVTLCFLAASHFPAHSCLGLAEASAWLVAALFAGVLMVSRGPERKLRGSYSTQRLWLELNREKLKEKYKLQ
jgi:hypothetical protein